MKLALSLSVAALLSAIATPSFACDRHGGGWGGHQMGGAIWMPYNEFQTQADIFVPEAGNPDWVTPAATPPKAPSKPSFSRASSRAADAAQARLLAKAMVAANAKSEKSNDDVAKTQSQSKPKSDG